MRRTQKGIAMVEFAVCGAILLLAIFAVLEIAYAMYVWNTVGEAVRRGARIAAVCPINDADVLEAAILADEGSSDSPVVKGFRTANIGLAYYTSAGAGTTSYDQASYVTVSIANFNFEFVTPFVGGTLTVPPFSTTVPTESLGYMPDTGDRGCPGA